MDHTACPEFLESEQKVLPKQLLKSFVGLIFRPATLGFNILEAENEICEIWPISVRDRLHQEQFGENCQPSGGHNNLEILDATLEHFDDKTAVLILLKLRAQKLNLVVFYDFSVQNLQDEIPELFIRVLLNAEKFSETSQDIELLLDIFA